MGSPYGGPMRSGPDGPPPLVLPHGLTGAEVLRAVAEARAAALEPDSLTIVGYGASGIAALSLALHQRRLGIGVAHAVCIGASGGDDPVSGRPLAVPTPPRTASRVTLVPGDDAASVAWAERTAVAWRDAGWPVHLAPNGGSSAAGGP
jgi:hypothetical protein